MPSNDNFTVNLSVKKSRALKFVILSESIVAAMFVGGLIATVTRSLPSPFDAIAIYAGLAGALAAVPLIYEFVKKILKPRMKLLQEPENTKEGP